MAEAGGEVLELYNLARDPGERHNLATRRWETVLRLKNIALNYYRWVYVQHRCLHTASFNIQSPAVFRELVPPRFLGLQTTKHVGYDGHNATTSSGQPHARWSQKLCCVFAFGQDWTIL